MIDFPTIASRGKKGKQVPRAPKNNAPTKRHFYALQTGGEKSGNGDDDEGKSLFFF